VRDALAARDTISTETTNTQNVFRVNDAMALLRGACFASMPVYFTSKTGAKPLISIFITKEIG
jgi:hypothetical protein